MVTLAQSSPGDRSARAPQSKTATVMLGGCSDYGIARLAPHNQRACQQQAAKHHAHGKRQKESRDITKVSAPGSDRDARGPIACGLGGCLVEARFLSENK